LLMVLTSTESPIVVVVSESMEPAYYRGDLLILSNKYRDWDEWSLPWTGKKEKPPIFDETFLTTNPPPNKSPSFFVRASPSTLVSASENRPRRRKPVRESSKPSAQQQQQPRLQRKIHPYTGQPLQEYEQVRGLDPRRLPPHAFTMEYNNPWRHFQKLLQVEPGDVCVFRTIDNPIPIVHRVIHIRAHPNGEFDFLTKGDNNVVDDSQGLYRHGVKWLHQDNIVGCARGYVPYIGYATILMTEDSRVKLVVIFLLFVSVIISTVQGRESS